MIHVYHGDGQGKTSAAMGLALRAVGAGWPVRVVQFLKDGSSHEVRALRELPGVRTVDAGDLARFTFEMDGAARAAARALHDANLRAALDEARAGGTRLLVLDEALDAYRADLLDEALLREALELGGADGRLGERARKRAERAGEEPPVFETPLLELVVTGHKLPVFVYDAADYVTLMQAEEHPFRRGVAAREGVEW